MRYVKAGLLHPVYHSLRKRSFRLSEIEQIEKHGFSNQLRSRSASRGGSVATFTCWLKERASRRRQISNALQVDAAFAQVFNAGRNQPMKSILITLAAVAALATSALAMNLKVAIETQNDALGRVYARCSRSIP